MKMVMDELKMKIKNVNFNDLKDFLFVKMFEFELIMVFKIYLYNLL